MPNGYFLFIEGAKIDYAHHLNLANQALYDTLALETAVVEVMKRVNTEDTLVLVTADHSHVFMYGSYVSRANFISNPTDDGNDLRGKPFTSMIYGNGPGYAISNTGARPILTPEDTNKLYYAHETPVPLASETHACEEVAVYAKGPQSHLVTSLVEQSTVAHLMMYAACLGPQSNGPHCQTARAAGDEGGRSSGGRFDWNLPLTVGLVAAVKVMHTL